MVTSYNFYFEKSGGNKGAGMTGEKDDKHYQSGMLMTAGSDEKYQIIKPIMSGTTLTGYTKYDDVADLTTGTSAIFDVSLILSDSKSGLMVSTRRLKMWGLMLYVPLKLRMVLYGEYTLINTSGKVIDNKCKSKDGNDYYYVVIN